MVPFPASIVGEERELGRYVMYGEIARGGMASVHAGRLLGPSGFARTVAIKRLHPHYARSADVVEMFLEEARLAARVRHPHVASVLDVIQLEGEIFLVMDYVHGESLARLWRPDRPLEPRLASAILIQALLGLHAAHETRDEHDTPLGIVHRDVSPQNVLVGQDGVVRVVDFGIAKAVARFNGMTTSGLIKGKLTYMAPERLADEPLIDRRVDIFAAGVVLWELLTARRLFQGSDAQVIEQVLHHRPEPPSKHRPGLSPELDELCLCALAADPDARFATAHEMARALEQCAPPASAMELSAWIEATAGPALRERAARISQVERASASVANRTSDPWAAEGTRPLSVRVSAAASASVDQAPPAPQTQPTSRMRALRWVLVLASVAIVTTVAGLSLGRRAQDAKVVQVNRQEPPVALPPAAATASTRAADELEPAEVQDSPLPDAGAASTQHVAPERSLKRSAQRARSANRAASPAKSKVDLGL
jgi:serine/threonine-protein kinase